MRRLDKQQKSESGAIPEDAQAAVRREGDVGAPSGALALISSSPLRLELSIQQYISTAVGPKAERPI